MEFDEPTKKRKADEEPEDPSEEESEDISEIPEDEDLGQLAQILWNLKLHDLVSDSFVHILRVIGDRLDATELALDRHLKTCKCNPDEPFGLHAGLDLKTKHGLCPRWEYVPPVREKSGTIKSFPPLKDGKRII